MKDGNLKLIETLDNANMGEAETLTDFLTWGQENYPTNHNMLVLWAHGGGSAKGVCFDENYGFDALTLPELKTAFDEAELSTKFDIIGFDACLMASIETAAVVQNFAEYMVVSEEIEPSGGWDYKALAESFAKETDYLEVGKTICDSFMEKCKKSNKDDISTLSLVNLSKLNPIFDHLDSLGKSLSEFVGKDNAFSKVISAAKRCEKFGYDSVFSGSSNMIDFLDFGKLVVLSDFDAFSKVYDIVEEAVVYSVTGEQRDNGGISFYYPIDYDEKEMTEYISLGISEPYNKFLSTYYLNAPDETIAFSDRGSVAENGAFEVSLTKESAKYLSSVTYHLIEKDEDGAEYILFSDVDIDSDWENGRFKDNFFGQWMTIGGEYVNAELIEETESYNRYSIPAEVNGKETNIRAIYDYSTETYRVLGTYDGVESSDGIGSMTSRGITPLQEGDEIVFLLPAYEADSEEENWYYTDAVEWSDDIIMEDEDMGDGYYMYMFEITDIFGVEYDTEPVIMQVEGDTVYQIAE